MSSNCAFKGDIQLCLEVPCNLEKAFQPNLYDYNNIVKPVKQWQFEHLLLHQNQQIISQLFQQEDFQEMWVVGTAPRHVDLGKINANHLKSRNQRCMSKRPYFGFSTFIRLLLNLTFLAVINYLAGMEI